MCQKEVFVTRWYQYKDDDNDDNVDDDNVSTVLHILWYAFNEKLL